MSHSVHHIFDATMLLNKDVGDFLVVGACDFTCTRHMAAVPCPYKLLLRYLAHRPVLGPVTVMSLGCHSLHNQYKDCLFQWLGWRTYQFSGLSPDSDEFHCILPGPLIAMLVQDTTLKLKGHGRGRMDGCVEIWWYEPSLVSSRCVQ